jgi:hypothetical protein
MIVRKQNHGYSSQRKYIQGKGFVDSLKSIGSYVAQNKDLIAKPLLGTFGNLAAAGLEQGVKALQARIINKKTNSIKNTQNSEDPLDSKAREILQSMMNSSNSNTPITNIIGSGIKKF